MRNVVFVVQGDARFVVTTKGSRILLSLKSASEELQLVLEEAKDFKLLSLKVTLQLYPELHIYIYLTLVYARVCPFVTAQLAMSPQLCTGQQEAKCIMS